MTNNLRISPYGIVGFTLVVLMIVIRMILVDVPSDNTSPIVYRLTRTLIDPYMLMAIIPYVALSLFVNRRLDSRFYTHHILSHQERLRFQNLYLGAQLAMVLLIIGLFLGITGIITRIFYYIIAVVFGLITPQLIFTNRQEISPGKNELEF